MFYDGTDDKSKLIGELFGTPSHKLVNSISSLGNSIFIDFKKYGFQENPLWYDSTVKFVAFIKYNKINSDCQSWLNDNTLASPNNPNINCSWIITRKFGSYITLDFSIIEVKQMNYHSKNDLFQFSIFENSLSVGLIT